jgi:hypothetical protein
MSELLKNLTGAIIRICPLPPKDCQMTGALVLGEDKIVPDWSNIVLFFTDKHAYIKIPDYLHQC